ncbi:unnamed protein product, partial [Staurois parvus]
RHQVILARHAGTASSGKAVAPSQQARQWAPPGHQVPDCLARQRASGSPGMTAGTGVTRHQVIWGLPAGKPRSSGKAVGTCGTVTRHWIVWLDSGIGSPGIRSFGLSGQGTASSPGKAVAPGHQVSSHTTAGSESIGSRQRAPDQVPDHLDQQRASSQL